MDPEKSKANSPLSKLEVNEISSLNEISILSTNPTKSSLINIDFKPTLSPSPNDLLDNPSFKKTKNELEWENKRESGLDSENDDTIYGIRTNINAVNEYCNLLTKHLMDGYTNLILQKITEVRLNQNNKEHTGFRKLFINQLDFTEELKTIKQRGEKRAGNPHPKQVLQLKRTDNVKENILDKIFKGDLDIQFNSSAEKNRSQLTQSSKKCWELKTQPLLMLDEQMFIRLENQILESYRDMNILEELFSMQKIYHRCIFDCFNELFSHYVNSSALFPLTRRDVLLKKEEILQREDLQYVLTRVNGFLIEIALQQCGIIKDKEDSLLVDEIKMCDSAKYSY